jgi:DNA-binding transcriptional LysR family regulator
MRLRHIEVFHAVYSCGSVTRAAKVLKVSQPSVSKVLAHAEQQLGYALFDRVRGKLIPTPEANQLFIEVAQVNDRVDRLRQVAFNLRSVDKGTIRIATTTAFGIDFLPGAIADYRQDHEDIMFSLETLKHEQLTDALVDSRIDIGLAYDQGNLPGVSGEPLGRGRFVVLCSDSMNPPGQGALQLEDLADLPFIRLDNQGSLDRSLTTHIEASGVELSPVCIAGSFQLAKALVSHGLGICIADEITARSGRNEGIVIRELEPEISFKISALHTDQESASLITKEFIEYLKTRLDAFLGKTGS